MKKLNKDKKKKATKPSYSPIYQRMYDAIGNEEIFWEWFWETILEQQDLTTFEEEFKDDPACMLLLDGLVWAGANSGFLFWSSLFKALIKNEAKK